MTACLGLCIAEESVMQVSRDLAAIQREWLKSGIMDLNDARARELSRMDKVEMEYWDAWEKSKTERKIIDGEQVNEMNVDKWDTPRKNPDGSKNKFGKAIKDLPRNGHIGFQDHGAVVKYRNMRILRLSKESQE